MILKLKKFFSNFQDKNNCNIKSFDVNIAIYSAEDKLGISHFDLWLPVLNKRSVNYIVILREYSLFNEIKKRYPQTSIIYVNKRKSLNKLVYKFKKLKYILYLSNIANNIDMVSYEHIKHIFIGHGDSDKSASAHKFFRVYDENWVAGQASIDRFKNAGFNSESIKFRKIGRPNLEDSLELSLTSWQSRFNGSIKALYLSTWEGSYKEQDYTSVYIIENIIKTIYNLNIKKLDIKLHPFLGKREKKLLNKKEKLENNSKELNITIHPKKKQISTLIKEHNIFICDISAVVTDCLAVNAPIFVYIPKNKEINIAKSKMSYSDYTYTFSTTKELYEKLKIVLNGNDYLKTKREEAMEYILGKSYTQNRHFYKYLGYSNE